MDAHLSERLDKIRSQANSRLLNQSSVARTLSAVDDVLQEEGINSSPTAYLVTLLSLLGSSVSPAEGEVNHQLAAPVLYLLDVILPSVPPQTLRTYYSRTIPSLVAVLETLSVTQKVNPEGTAAIIKSTIGAIETLILAQDFGAWKSRDEMSVQHVFTGFLVGNGMDPRPKVRKRVSEAIKKILVNPPPNPSATHPAGDGTAMICFHTVQAQFSQAKKGKDGGERDGKAVHSLQLLKTVASAVSWAKSSIRDLVELLLKLSSEVYDGIVRLAALEVFQVIFGQASEEMNAERLREVIEMVLADKPEKTDIQLLPSWLAVIAAGYNAYADLDADNCLQRVPELLRQIFPFLQAESENVREAVGSTLVALAENCISVEASPEIQDEAFQAIAELAMQGLTARYQLAWREVFRFVGAIFLALRQNANPLFLDTIKIIDSMRARHGFEGKAEAEAVIGAAVTGVGPAAVLKVIPLNLEKQGPGNPGRAWLLPIFKSHIKNTELSHFSEYFVPLSERLYQKVIEGESVKAKTMEVKILETVVDQIWALLPSYCDLPTDLDKAFNQPFAELLANVLYQQINLRQIVCHALTNLVQKNQDLLRQNLNDAEMIRRYRLTVGEVQQNVNLMATFSANFLSVLFNVFTQTMPPYRSPIADCIKAFLSISSSEDLRTTLEKVGGLLQVNLNNPTKGEKTDLPTLPQAAIDLTNIMIPYLPSDTFEGLWNLFVPLLRLKEDPNMQRRAYRSLAKLAEIEAGKDFLVNRLDQVTEILKRSDTHTTSQKDRILALHQIVDIIPTQSLHLIATILPEAVIGTKEANEKAREAAYDLLITMGQKMQRGGTVKNAMIDGMDEDTEDTSATIEQYFLMVSAGLAGSSQHMISATITALSRMLYEFKGTSPNLQTLITDDLSDEVIDDLLSTMEVFLTSKSREIARSAIGFIKVALVTLPKEVMEGRLEKLLPNLMVWSHETKGHFRVKVKSLMERMIRKFGYETIVKYTPEADHKLLVNIRKTRERKKRGKEMGEDVADEDVRVIPRQEPSNSETTNAQSAYDAVLYGSDSEISDSEDENPKQTRKPKKGSRKQDTFIREGSDEPVDLLDQNALSHVSSHQPITQDEEFRRRAKAASRASTFKSNQDGRMIIEEPKPTSRKMENNGKEYNAYEEMQESNDMAKRGFRDKIKFSNKRSRQDAEDFDVEMTDAYEERPPKAPVKKRNVVFEGSKKGFQKRRPIQ